MILPMKNILSIACCVGFLSLFCNPEVGRAAPGDGVKQTLQAYVRAWDDANPQKIASYYDETGDFLNPTGTLATGRAQIAGFYATAFAHGYAGSEAGASISRLRFIGDNTALVDGTWSILHARGYQNKVHDEHGTFVAILVKRDHGWQIEALREAWSAKP